MLNLKSSVTYGPYLDGRTVYEYSFPGLPGWKSKVLEISGEPGAGPYMTLPRVIPLGHPWATPQDLAHPMVQRYGEA